MIKWLKCLVGLHVWQPRTYYLCELPGGALGHRETRRCSACGRWDIRYATTAKERH